MDWRTLSSRWNGDHNQSNGGEDGRGPFEAPRRWIAHGKHERVAVPHRTGPQGSGEGVIERSVDVSLRPHRAEHVILEGNPLQPQVRPLTQAADPALRDEFLGQRLAE